MKKQALKEQIRWELSQLKRVAESAREMAALPEAKRDPWDATAAAKYVSDVIHGLENLWRRRCAFLSEPLPQGPDSHSRILNCFLQNPSLGGHLPPEIADRLKMYMRFRHRFIHGYAFEPDWAMVKEPLGLMPETITAMEEVWESWLNELADDASHE